MNNYIRHGAYPSRAVFVHGGPGAAGEMRIPAEKLSESTGILEPFQTKLSIAGQIEELKNSVISGAVSPAVLLGFSWGAWLSVLMTAKYPELVSKLIIVGAGPFEEKYTARIRDTRLKRLDHGQRAFIRNVMENGTFQESDNPRKIGKIFSEGDSFNFSEAKPEAICFKPEIFNRVWPEAAELRRSGKLLEAASKIKCPVIAVHGDYDPHPAEGVEVPLKRALLNFSFIKLSRCGHKPWLEKFAREKFYSLIREELLKA